MQETMSWEQQIEHEFDQPLGRPLDGASSRPCWKPSPPDASYSPDDLHILNKELPAAQVAPDIHDVEEPAEKEGKINGSHSVLENGLLPIFLKDNIILTFCFILKLENIRYPGLPTIAFVPVVELDSDNINLNTDKDFDDLTEELKRKQHKYVLIPTNTGIEKMTNGKRRGHYSLFVVDLEERSIKYYEPYQRKRTDKNAESIGIGKLKEFFDKVKTPFKTQIGPFKTQIVKDLPSQPINNGNDCGVFVCDYADSVTQDRRMNYSLTIDDRRRGIEVKILKHEQEEAAEVNRKRSKTIKIKESTEKIDSNSKRNWTGLRMKADLSPSPTDIDWTVRPNDLSPSLPETNQQSQWMDQTTGTASRQGACAADKMKADLSPSPTDIDGTVRPNDLPLSLPETNQQSREMGQTTRTVSLQGACAADKADVVNRKGSKMKTDLSPSPTDIDGIVMPNDLLPSLPETNQQSQWMDQTTGTASRQGACAADKSTNQRDELDDSPLSPSSYDGDWDHPDWRGLE